MSQKLLCLSNGHGEDAIAVSILEQLSKTGVEVQALPLVGKGVNYKLHNIPLIGTTQSLPSGGFIYMDNQQLWQDVQSGLLQLTLQQYQSVKQWVKEQKTDEIGILAVGDILPLLLAWMSGVNYAFVGTAKSEYYLRNEEGWLPETPWLLRSLESIYFPWERWLMQSSRCRGVYPRDHLTAQTLLQYSLRVFDCGNPMMDVVDHIPIGEETRETMTILLLPGSRPPEAESNWEKILDGVESVLDTFSEESLLFLGAIAPTLNLTNLEISLLNQGWQRETERKISFLAINAPLFSKKNAILALSQEKYATCLVKAQIAIAMAGTATEQFVGLGKPAIAIPGTGPQYTPSFATAQQKLLGSSLILVEKPDQIGKMILDIFQDTVKLKEIAKNGKQRMGKPGASQAIAQSIYCNLFQKL